LIYHDWVNISLRDFTKGIDKASGGLVQMLFLRLSLALSILGRIANATAAASVTVRIEC